MELKDNYIIFQPKTPVKTTKTAGNKQVEEKKPPLTGERLNKDLTNWHDFYQGKDSAFTPVNDKPAPETDRVKTGDKPAGKEKGVETPGDTKSTTRASTVEKVETAKVEEKKDTQQKVLTENHILKADQYPGIHCLKEVKLNKTSLKQLKKDKWFEFNDKNMKELEGQLGKEKSDIIQKELKNKNLSEEELNKKLKDMNFSKEEAEIVAKNTKSQFSPEKLDTIDKLRNKKFSKEELTTELLKSGFSQTEVDRVMKETYKPEGGKFKEIEGAPNYRKTKGIHGTGQPTVEGLRKVLDEAGGKKKEVKWVNLREEPVIYIDGKPHNLRLKSHDTENLKQPGITAEKLEEQEKQLKAELIEESKRNGGYITLHEEVKDKDGKWVTVSKKVKVSEDSVKTTKDVFQDMEKEGYKIDYKRIPITDEHDPEKGDIDKLVNALKDADPDTPLVFNCHAGRGRTTTGTVIADLMRSAPKDGSGKDDLIRKNKSFKLLFREFAGNPEGEGSRLRALLSLIDTVQTAKTPEDVDRVINALKGTPGKSEQAANDAIDREGQVQNLREATIKQLEKFKTDPAAREKAETFLKRYFKIVAFQEYVKETGGNGYNPPFSQWMDNNKNLNDMYDRVKLAFNSMGPGEMDGSVMA